MVEFARAAMLGKDSVPGAGRWAEVKELVSTRPDSWEPSWRPGVR
jgi:hypothetical protein